MSIGQGLSNIATRIENRRIRKHERERDQRQDLRNAAQQTFMNNIRSEQLQVSKDNLKVAQEKIKAEKEKRKLTLDRLALDNLLLSSTSLGGGGQPTASAPSLGSDIEAEIALPSEGGEVAQQPENGLILDSNIGAVEQPAQGLTPNIVDSVKPPPRNLMQETNDAYEKMNRLIQEQQRDSQIMSQASPAAQNSYRINSNSAIEAQKKVAYGKMALLQQKEAQVQAVAKHRTREIQNASNLLVLEEDKTNKQKAQKQALGMVRDIDKVVNDIEAGIDIFGSAHGTEFGQNINKFISFVEASFDNKDLFEGRGMETKGTQNAFTRIKGEQIINKINAASFGQLSDGEREFLSNIVINQTDSIEDLLPLLKQLRDVSVLGLDKSGFVKAITDPELRKKISEEVRHIEDPIEFIKYKGIFVDKNSDFIQKMPKTASIKDISTNAEFDKIRIGDQFRDLNTGDIHTKTKERE